MKQIYKLKESSPKNKDFFDQFQPIIPTLDSIGKAAQVVSAVTEAITVWKIVQTELSAVDKTIAILVSIFAMILIVSILELGGRRFLQVATRSLVWKRFSNVWYIALFVIVSSITISIAFLSFKLSTNGIRHSFVEKVEVGTRFDDSHLIKERDKAFDRVNQQFGEERAIIEKNHEKRVSAAMVKHNMEMNESELKAKIYNEKAQTGIRWAKGHAEKEQKRVARQAIKKAKLVEQMGKDHITVFEDWQQRKNTAIAKVQKEFKRNLASEKADFTKQHQVKLKQANLWGGIFAGLIGFSVLLAFICIVTVEIFRRGSGIEVHYEVTEKEPVLIALIWKGVIGRLRGAFRKPAERFADPNSTLKNRTIGFKGTHSFSENSVKSTERAPELQEVE